MGSIPDHSSWKAIFHCHPFDLGFVLVHPVLYCHLVPSECASSGAGLVWLFVFSLSPLPLHLPGFNSFTLTHMCSTTTLVPEAILCPDTIFQALPTLPLSLNSGYRIHLYSINALH